MSPDVRKRDTDATAAAAAELAPNARGAYRVVLDGVRLDAETPESFAIKFSVLSHSPIPKVKNMLRRLPAVVWSGNGLARAQKLVALIEEAGGKARIEESAPAPAAAPKPEAERSGTSRSCTQCGFPLKDGDQYCGFCMSAVDGSEKRAQPASRAKQRTYIVPPYRLLCYTIILLVGIIISFLSR